jgi:hypothetical protein
MFTSAAGGQVIQNTMPPNTKGTEATILTGLLCRQYGQDCRTDMIMRPRTIRQMPKATTTQHHNMTVCLNTITEYSVLPSNDTVNNHRPTDNIMIPRNNEDHQHQNRHVEIFHTTDATYPRLVNNRSIITSTMDNVEIHRTEYRISMPPSQQPNHDQSTSTTNHNYRFAPLFEIEYEWLRQHHEIAHMITNRYRRR